MITEIPGVLEIDHDRGVIYFHTENTGANPTFLRICRLGPIPEPVSSIDVTHMYGAHF